MTLQDVRPVVKLFNNRIKVKWMLDYCRVARSSYYYRIQAGRRGRKLSTHTAMRSGDQVSNDSVVIAIRFLLGIEFVNYGYDKTSDALKIDGFMINKKKVYGLMKRNHLLCGTTFRSKGVKRQFVRQYVQQQTDGPMKQLTMDIKYIYIHGSGRNALMLTILDVYSRRVVGQILWWSIRKHQVVWLIGKILDRYMVEGITIRNDNGSQFIAHLVREYLQQRNVTQEFIHVATPQENAFIEGYHSIVEKEVIDRYEFESVYQAAMVFARWKKFYNEVRLHGSLGNKTPQQVWVEHSQRVDPLRPQETQATKDPRPAWALEKSSDDHAALYSLGSFGDQAIFADSGSTNGTKNRLTNLDVMSNY